MSGPFRFPDRETTLPNLSNVLLRSSYPRPIANYRGRQIFGYPVPASALIQYGKTHRLDHEGAVPDRDVIISAVRHILNEIGSPRVLHYVRVPGIPIVVEGDHAIGLAICTNRKSEREVYITEARVKKLQELLGRADAPAWYEVYRSSDQDN